MTEPHLREVETEWFLIEGDDEKIIWFFKPSLKTLVARLNEASQQMVKDKEEKK